MTAGSRFPIVTLILIAANLAAAFLLLVQPDLGYYYGFRPNQPRLHAALTSLFLHANVLHLLGNMLFLAAVGAAVELATGSIRFAIVYFASGLVGTLLHFLLMRSAPDPAPLIGASGAIAGCAAYYTIRYTSLKVPVVPKVALPILGVTLLWLALQIGGAFVRIGEASGTAYWAHLGGFATGLLLSFVFRAPDPGQIQLGHETIDQISTRGPGATVTAAIRHLERHPKDPKALSDLAAAYRDLGEKQKEADALSQLLDAAPGEQPETIRRLAQTGYLSRISVLRRLQIADRHPEVAKILLMSVIEGPEDPQTPDAMLALAALERTENPDSPSATLQELQRRYPLHPATDLARKRGWLT